MEPCMCDLIGCMAEQVWLWARLPRAPRTRHSQRPGRARRARGAAARALPVPRCPRAARRAALPHWSLPHWRTRFHLPEREVNSLREHTSRTVLLVSCIPAATPWFNLFIRSLR